MISVFNADPISSLCQIHIPSTYIPEPKVFECQLDASNIPDELPHILCGSNLILHIFVRLINPLACSESFYHIIDRAAKATIHVSVPYFVSGLCVSEINFCPTHTWEIVLLGIGTGRIEVYILPE